MDAVFFRFLGLAGTLLIALAVLFSGVRYYGRRGERYSVLNHFISELGEVGVSPAARVFNTGLAVGGLLLAPFMVGLGLALNSTLGWLGTLAGVVAALAVAAVGLYPMNQLTPHVRAAMTYFRSGLVMVLFYELAILLPPAGARAASPVMILLGLLAFGSYAAFLGVMMRKPKEGEPRVHQILDPLSVKERPRVWPLAILEWAIFFSTVLWIFGAAATWMA
jgi:hypothetical membrane protein